MIDLVREKLGEIRALCERFHVRRLEVFGSSADGRYEEGRSDLDFVVDFEEMEPEDKADAFFSLLEGLEDLFERPVDLLTLKPDSEMNPYLLKEMDKSRQVIHGQPRQEVAG